jgi:two-component system sensor histidine kinase RegB
VAVNLLLRIQYPASHRLSDNIATALLGFDILQLAALLYFTGGLENPFAMLFLAPVLISATALTPERTLGLGLLAVGSATLLVLAHRPLPWFPGESFKLPFLYVTGIWTAILLGTAFTGIYAWRVAEEARQLAQALAATELVLAREQHLSQLDGLAAAAAHELGTPLATIQVVAKELLRSSPQDDPVADDARLLLQQAERCRDILKTLAQKPETGDIVHARLGLAQLLDEVAEPYRNVGPQVITVVDGPPGEFVPDVWRLPEIVHALSAFVENAVDFAASVVEVVARFDTETVSVEVRDDGPGFSSDILLKLGEPYVTSRPQGEGSRTHHQGMGLGFFIAKTLLERTGAIVTFGNERTGGAVIITKWPRPVLEAPDTLEHRSG